MQNDISDIFTTIENTFSNCFGKSFAKKMFIETTKFLKKDYDNYLADCNKIYNTYLNDDLAIIMGLTTFIKELDNISKERFDEPYFKKHSVLADNITVFLTENAYWAKSDDIQAMCVNTIKANLAKAKEDYCEKFNINIEEVIMGRDVDAEFDQYLNKWHVTTVKMKVLYSLCQGNYTSSWLN